jgi:hypothetical protein
MKLRRLSLAVFTAGMLISPTQHLFGQADPKQDPAKLEFFEKKVRPLLVENCYNCRRTTKPLADCESTITTACCRAVVAARLWWSASPKKVC